MRRIWLWLAVPAALGIVAACTGDDPALAPAGGTDAGDAGDERLEAPLDASDGATKTGYCATRTGDVYCEDFDSLLKPDSLIPETSKGGAVALTQGQSKSPPISVRFTLMENEPGSFAVFKRNIASDLPVRVELDMWFQELDATSPGQTVQSITIAREKAHVALARACADADGGPSCGYFVSLCFFNVEGGTQCKLHELARRPAAFEGWSHLFFEAKFGDDGYFKLGQDAETLVDVKTVTHLGPIPAGTPTFLTVGVGITQGTAGRTNLLVDNVSVQLR